MLKLDLEKSKEPEIKCQHPLDHRKSKRVPEKHLFLLYWLCQSLWLCGSQQITCLLRNLYGGQEATEKAMGTHSRTLAWKTPWTEEPGRLQTMELRRVRHDWATSLSLFTFMHWRRKWQPTPVFLPGESQGWRSLVGCHLWGRTESDTTEAT